MVNTGVKMRSEETKAYMEASHGNPTRSITKVFRPSQHSSKVDARQSLGCSKSDHS